MSPAGEASEPQPAPTPEVAPARRLGLVVGARRLLPYFRPYRARFVLVVGLAITGALAEGGQAALLAPLLNRVLLRGQTGDDEDADVKLGRSLAAAQPAAVASALAGPRRPGDPAAFEAAIASLVVSTGRTAPAAWGEDPVCQLLSRTRGVLAEQARTADDAAAKDRAALADAIALQAMAEARVLPDPPAAPAADKAVAAALSLEARAAGRDAGFGGALEQLKWILLEALGLAVVLGLARYLVTTLSAEVVALVYRDLQIAVVRRVLALSLGQLQATTRGDLLSRLTTDLARLVNGVLLPLIQTVLIEPARVLFLLVVAAVVSWPLTIGLILLGVVVMWPIQWWGKFIRRSARRRQSALGEVLEAMHQMLAGIRIVKAFRREDWERARFRQKTDAAYRAEVGVVRARTASRTWIHFVNDVSFPLVFLVGGWLVVSHTLGLDAGRFATFAALIIFIYRPTKSMVMDYNTLQDCLPSMERALEVLDLRPTITSRPGAPAIEAPRTAIEVAGVSFRYGEALVLDDVSFRAPVGTTTAIVGPTGAGKTTLMDIIGRFLEPAAGRVLVDGRSLADVDLASWQARLALVAQDAFLFNDTVRENIRYGRLDASDAEVEEAARQARVHDEVLGLPGGYAFVVGEHGGRLSGGQVQRLTIARAILRRPDVLLLDEAMSALDTRTERLVQDALEDFERDRTTFVIAHRLSTVKHADLILVLDAGRIVERGTHEGLKDVPGGRYAGLLRGRLLRDDGDGEPSAP